jgi:hypothetical protein
MRRSGGRARARSRSRSSLSPAPRRELAHVLPNGNEGGPTRRRLYLVMPDLPSARRIMDDLLLARIEERHIHILGKRGTRMDGRHEANVLQKTDIVHGAKLGTTIGAAFGAWTTSPANRDRPYGRFRQARRRDSRRRHPRLPHRDGEGECRSRGAGRGSRIPTVLLPADFESAASTSSAIPARTRARSLRRAVLRCP